MKKTLLIKDFWPYEDNGTHDAFVEDLGWDEHDARDAMSDDPEKIFRYYVEVVGLNIMFYWTVDGQFYTIYTECLPTDVIRIFPNPNWDGKYVLQKAGEFDGPCSGSAGDVIASFDDPTKIWDELKINGVPIGEVLEKSLILALD